MGLGQGETEADMPPLGRLQLAGAGELELARRGAQSGLCARPVVHCRVSAE